MSTLSTEQLINECQPMLMGIAHKIHRRLPPNVNLDDVVAYGQLGLAQAARSYRADLGTTFSTFAYYRIRGAIYDGLANMNMANQTAWKHYQAMQAAHNVFTAATPTAEDPVEESADWVAQKTKQLAVVYLLSSGEEDAGPESVEDQKSTTPAEQAEANETSELLREAIHELPTFERELIVGVYFEGLSLKELADRFKKSKSWSTRLHQKALSDLANALRVKCGV